MKVEGEEMIERWKRKKGGKLKEGRDKRELEVEGGSELAGSKTNLARLI